MTKAINLQELKKRFNDANKLILEHPNFNEDERAAATNYSAVYMAVLDRMLEETNGELTDDINNVLAPVVDFLDLVDEQCALK